MEKIIFKNDKERNDMKLELRKEIIHEICEDVKCRECKRFKKYIIKHKAGTKIEDQRDEQKAT